METAKKRTRRASAAKTPAARSTVPKLLARLERAGTKATRDGMARYGIVSPKAYGVTVAQLRRFAREIGKDHALAMDLWETGWYEARMLACFVADADALTIREMDRWARDFDNWAITDTACFSLFDQSPHAWGRVDQWCRRKDEFVRRAGFALLASLALHDKSGEDTAYRKRLALVEEFANDDRNFVKKGVSWALDAIGRRSASLNREALALARKLAASADPGERWVGKDALRKLTSRTVRSKRGKATATEPRSR
jgi:3-methyladenine DNA glycosylase AlkD